MPLVYSSPRASKQAAQLMPGVVLEKLVAEAIARGEVDSGRGGGVRFLPGSPLGTHDDSWSHHSRLRNEACFARLAGVAPILAPSSGQTRGHRLSRGGDRQLNRALHTIVLPASRFRPERLGIRGTRRHPEGARAVARRRFLRGL